MRRSLLILILILFAIWLGSVAVLMLFLTGIVKIPWLVAALVCQIGAAIFGSGLLLVTNTRRPAGIDPDTAPITLPDGAVYGRRQGDDRSVVDRLSAILEEEAAQRPGPARTPDWAIDTRHDEEPPA